MVDDVRFPPDPYTPDFSTHLYAGAYYTAQKELAWQNDDPVGGLDAFSRGTAIFPISLTTGRSPNDQVEIRQVEMGTLNLKIRLRTPARLVISVIIIAYYQQVLQLGGDRLPRWLD